MTHILNIHNLKTVAMLKPSAEYNRRAAIIESVRAGRSATEIIRFFGYPRSTVYDVVAKYNQSEKSNEGFATPARKTHSKKRVVRTPEILQRTQELIFEDPGQSIRKLSSLVGVSEKTMRRIVEEDLRYKSYTIKVRQMLSEAARTKRVERCNLLLCSLRNNAAGRLRFFSDEKIFTVDAKINRRNDRWLAHDPEDIPIVSRTKFPANVHVLSVVSSEGDVMPPHFFNKGENVTKEVYLNVLINVVKPWMEIVSSGKPYVFQQDGAPAHTSHLVQNWLSDNVDMFWSKEFWPPNSPDLNPLDFYVWSVIERVTNKSRHPNLASLRAAIEAAFADMDRDSLKRACERFRPRLEAVIQAGGGYIE
ncbi:Transposable element Tcb1 transposase [Anthophora retusa]